MGLHLLRPMIKGLGRGRKKTMRKKARRRSRRKQKKGINISYGEEDGTAEPTISPWPFTCSFWSPLTQWFAPDPRLSILASCPGQSDPLNTLCCVPGTHSFASSDDADCLARPRLRLPATACQRETSGLSPDAARRPSLTCPQST